MGGGGDEKVVIVFWVEDNFYFCPESLTFFKTKKKKKKKNLRCNTMVDLTFLGGSVGEDEIFFLSIFKKKKNGYTQQVSTLKLKTEDKCPII